MSVNTSIVVQYLFGRTHDWMLAFAEKLSDEELAWGPPGGAPTLGFHLWHSARWADLLQSRLPQMTPAMQERLASRGQICDVEEVCAAWGIDGVALGENATGMGIADEIAAGLKLPAKEELLRYVGRAFDAAKEAAASVDDQQLDSACTDLYGRPSTLAAVLLGQVTHLSRHLGMTEALRGVHSGRGTATV